MNTIAADKVVKHELWIFSKPELAATPTGKDT